MKGVPPVIPLPGLEAATVPELLACTDGKTLMAAPLQMQRACLYSK